MKILPEQDLLSNWAAFCDCDYFDGVGDFCERMEKHGLIELVAVNDAALESAFAYERGIEKGGSMWALTTLGRELLAANEEEPDLVTLAELKRRRAERAGEKP